MRKIIFVLWMMVSLNFANAQAPGKQWAKCYGGSGGEIANSIQQTADGGYIVAGYTSSNDGDVTGNHGHDFWVVKLNSSGIIQWQKTLGGTEFDRANSIQQTADGGYIVAGTTSSNDGDVTGNHGNDDYWVVKLNSTGAIQWQKTLGGSDYELATSIQQTADGGYIVAGTTSSNDGDVTGNHAADFWVVKLNSTGAIQWQKTLGGSDYEIANSIQQTADGGYIVAGYTKSNDGDVTGNHGHDDFWVVKLNSTGLLQWQKTYGGNSSDLAYSIQQTADGGYIVAGYTKSNDGDVTGNHGSNDFWVVKLNSTGLLQWQKTYGGNSSDVAYSIQQTTDFGYIVAGGTNSNNGDVTGYHGTMDYWITKLDSAGILQWQKTLGGYDYEAANSIKQTADGGYIVAGWTYSTNGDVIGYHGNVDFWVVKLAPASLPLKLLSFTTKLQQNHILLNWQTTNEINVSHINIQRSLNGKDFIAIGKVNAACCEYSFVDGQLSIIDGKLYYKLEIVDKDGSKTYSEIKMVEVKSQNQKVNIYPNPSKDFVTIECKGAKEVLIIDCLGKTVKQFNHPTEHQTLNTKQLTKGVYVVKAIMNNGEVKNEKLIIN